MIVICVKVYYVAKQARFIFVIIGEKDCVGFGSCQIY